MQNDWILMRDKGSNRISAIYLCHEYTNKKDKTDKQTHKTVTQTRGQHREALLVDNSRRTIAHMTRKDNAVVSKILIDLY